MNDATIIKNYADALDGNRCDKLNIDLDYGFKLVGRDVNVKELCAEYVAQHDSGLSASSMQMSLGAAIKLAEFFGSRAKCDRAINAYNASAKVAVYNVRTLVAKLVPGGEKAGKGQADKFARAAKDVKALSDAEFKRLMNAELKRRGISL